MQEIWKNIKEYEGYYQISNLGRVKSLSRNVNGPHGTRRIKEKIRSNNKLSHGYEIIILSKFGEKKVFSIHRLVAEHFIPNPEDKPAVDHINGIKHDNRAENLEWLTHHENMEHAIKNGMFDFKGEKHNVSKLTNEQAKEIKNF